MVTIDRVGTVLAKLGECPLWSAAEQVLYWTDIDGRVLHRYDPQTDIDDTRDCDGRVGSFVLGQAPGRLLLAQEHELVWFDWTSGDKEHFLTLEEPDTGNRLNDGRTDPRGRFVVGSMWAQASAGRSTGFLWQIEPDGTARLLQSEIGVTNGIAFDAERSRMYFTDTLTEIVYRYDYDLDTGERSNPQPFLDYRELPGKPDGGCVDADGCYWSASVYGWALVRVTPDGAIDRRIELPVEKPSMPAFGGSDLDTLYVTTIGAGGSFPSEPAHDGFEAGCLLALDVGVAGQTDVAFPG